MTIEIDSLPKQKVFGIGLNKTGTKTLAAYLRSWGYRNRTYDSNTVDESPSFRLYEAGKIEELLDLLEDFDSCEDWPWPLLYRELDERYPDARFILTTRRSGDVWYRSLCKMAVRIGPLPLYEATVYGSSMPQGRREHHLAYYEAHNRAVEEYFRDRPGKLLALCWECGDDLEKLAAFLGEDAGMLEPVHANRTTVKIYGGQNLLLAHAHRLIYQNFRAHDTKFQRIVRRLRRLGGRTSDT